MNSGLVRRNRRRKLLALGSVASLGLLATLPMVTVQAADPLPLRVISDPNPTGFGAPGSDQRADPSHPSHREAIQYVIDRSE
jgi:hypothetical protein